jgi:hypothetical protein
MLMLADQIAAAETDPAPGEAAVTVASRAAGREDAALLLDILGLGPGTAYRWGVPRVALTAITHGRLGRAWSAVSLRTLVPPRGHPAIPVAVARLCAEGLAERTGQVVRSTSPGARGRMVPVYRLTRAGEDLAARVAPLPGQSSAWYHVV